MGLSVAIITYNEEKNIERTLKAVQDISDEIVIVDSGSRDRTVEICRKYGANVIEQPWLGYGKQRNLAIEKSTQEWVLNIDADEEITPELRRKIKEIIDAKEQKDVYKIKFTTVCFGKKLRHGGWSGSSHIRLFKKNSGKFNDNLVHEAFESIGTIGTLEEEILHHSYNTLEDYFSKFNRYTTEGALDYYKKGKKTGLFQIVLNPLYKFLRMYIFRLGFLDGVEGFLIATTSAIYSMVKYFKLREIYRNGSYLDKIK